MILVDGVHLPEGPKVGGTRSVDPVTEDLPDGLYTVLRGASTVLGRVPPVGGFVLPIASEVRRATQLAEAAQYFHHAATAANFPEKEKAQPSEGGGPFVLVEPAVLTSADGP